jgi:hypothetical protein
MVSIFRVRLVRFIIKSVTIIEKGIDIPIIIVLLTFRKNKNSITIARIDPSRAELTSSLIMFRVCVVLS